MMPAAAAPQPMPEYSPSPLTPDEVSLTPGCLILDFGAPWCGHCARARALVDPVLGAHPSLNHVRIEDGPGRRLGRHFKVKLWPTLIFLHDGVERARVVRPQQPQEVEDALAAMGPCP
ncbi:thioredoxin family protein [Nitrogeniibacter aestuarii]|uniref:thioredoxin family protein n=1 Tax=Nitrogeniibacter aestuarii TaxID=2815343 RepID=UPI001D0F9E29|nr:thioredoxin family protein [Nitrogeniibacter aestuarii]